MKPLSWRKPGIDVAHHPGIRPWNLGDDIAPEPFDGPRLREAVDLGRALARVDRAGHEDHRARHGRVVRRFHQRDRGKHRDGRLADRHDMHVSTKKPNKLNNVVDIIVEVERSVGARHEARVLPLDNIDVVIGEEVAHRAAQQRRKMPGKGRDDEHLRIGAQAPARQLTLEMHEIAKRLGDQGPLPDRDFAPLHLGLADAPNRAAVAPRGALEQLERGRGAAAKRGVGGRDSADCGTEGDRHPPRPAQGSRRPGSARTGDKASLDLSR